VSTTLSVRKLATWSDALVRIPIVAWRRLSIRAAASALASPTGTSSPSTLSAMISDGPLGQSVDTANAPHAMASIKANYLGARPCDETGECTDNVGMVNLGNQRRRLNGSEVPH